MRELVGNFLTRLRSLFIALVNYYFTIEKLKLVQFIFQIYRRLRPSSNSLWLNLEKSKSIETMVFYKPKYVTFKNNGCDIFDEFIKFESEPYFSKKNEDYLYEFSFYYLEFLLESDVKPSDVLTILRILERKEFVSKYLFHPYTASKRIITCIVLYSQYGVRADVQQLLLARLRADVCFLAANIEYHIDANHLLTNYVALALAAKIFDSKKLNTFVERYVNEFEVQFNSGTHYERSFSYSKQLVYEFCLFHQLYKDKIPPHVSDLVQKALFELKLKEEYCCTGFGDNIDEQCCSLEWLINYNKESLGLNLELPSAPSCFVTADKYVLINAGSIKAALDAGAPEPAHQPGHANDSTGAIVVAFNGCEIITCSGTSTYSNNPQREFERSRFAYSKPISEGPSQVVWSSFRVAKRRVPKLRAKCDNGVELEVHSSIGTFSRHVHSCDGNALEIRDRFQRRGTKKIQFILSKSVKVSSVGTRNFLLQSKDICLEVSVSEGVKIRQDVKDVGFQYGQLRRATAITLETNEMELFTNWRLM
ncbi:MAG: heparinase II/III family protein [Bacteroidetes bacterium]|nr:heparinase II/III family protein [Bacteroidota bacterium]MDA0851616.1 heparinase II/III family protein [Pseudomonadota bacterium]